MKADYLSDFSLNTGQRERSPVYQKLCTRDTHIRGILRGQPNRSAMEGPHPGGTVFVITVMPMQVLGYI